MNGRAVVSALAIVPSALLALVACSPGEPAAESSVADSRSSQVNRPNVLLIVADDLGYTDLGVFGSEIPTPNLDALARHSVLFTNFHTAPTCSPTRAMLFSGTDHHLAGLGSMDTWMRNEAPDLLGRPGYEGYLNFRVASLANLMKDAGYRTYMAGKWHLGMTEETSPAARGFDRSFALLNGGSGHFDDLGLFGGKSEYRKDGKLTELPDDFYSTRFYTDTMIQYLRDGMEDSRPFFAYLSFTAPHFPLQAPKESIAKYHGRYDEGYEILFERRMQALKELGLIDNATSGPALLDGQPSWNDLSDEEQRREARVMEIYAAMIDDMDVNVGRLLAALEDTGEYEDTIVFFMSDNGAEGMDYHTGPAIFPAWVEECCDNSFDNMGAADSYVLLGPNWAHVAVGPGRLFKQFTTEGGIRTPALITQLGKNQIGRRFDGFVSVMDVLPTMLDLAGGVHPGGQYRGRDVLPVKGTSFAALLDRDDAPVHGDEFEMGWELFGRQAFRKGDWKILRMPPPHDDGTWRLYNLAEDRLEQHDLANTAPEKLRELLALWKQYAAENGVIDLVDRLSHSD